MNKKRSSAFANGERAGRRLHLVPCTLWKPIWKSYFAIFRLPPAQRRRLRTTNVIERLFVEVRRRIRTMCAFTTRDSCERILFSVFYRMNQYWAKHPLKPFTQIFVTPPKLGVKGKRLDRMLRIMYKNLVASSDASTHFRPG